MCARVFDVDDRIEHDRVRAHERVLDEGRFPDLARASDDDGREAFQKHPEAL
jgi:hypothetical protein